MGKPFSAVTKIFFTCLLILAPSVNLTVDTFPDKRGRLAFPILFFAYSFDS